MKIVQAKKVKTVQPMKKINANSSFKIFNERVKVVDADSNKTLAIFLKNEIKDQFLLDAGRDLQRYAAATTLRVESAGLKEVGMLQGQKFRTANKVLSSIVGYSDPSTFYPCRQTKLYRDNTKHFDTITVKLIQELSQLFKKYAPKECTLQKKFINGINQNMILDKTVYTTITVNKDFRTLTHRDTGDYDSGLGNLMVFDYTKGYCTKHNCEHKVSDCSKNLKGFEGGEFLLPEYNVGFNMQEGDVLFADVHQIHCNNKIKGKGRVSVVCYAREGIAKKCDKITKKQLKEFKRH